MEAIVDRIRALCREKETSITKLEVELGYANGTIGKWAKAKRKPPLEKVIAVADKLGCNAEYLLTGAGQVETELGKLSVLSNKEEFTGIKKEAWEMIQQMDDDTLAKFIKAAKAMLGD